MHREDIISSFHRILVLKDRAVCASIDAANCRTPTDWQRSHEAEDALAEAVERFEAVLAALGEDPPLLGREDLVRYSGTEVVSIVEAIAAIREGQPARAIARLATIAEGHEQANAIAQAESQPR